MYCSQCRSNLRWRYGDLANDWSPSWAPCGIGCIMQVQLSHGSQRSAAGLESCWIADVMWSQQWAKQMAHVCVTVRTRQDRLPNFVALFLSEEKKTLLPCWRRQGKCFWMDVYVRGSEKVWNFGKARDVFYRPPCTRSILLFAGRRSVCGSGGRSCVLV
jgi:hypothetical protein